MACVCGVSYLKVGFGRLGGVSLDASCHGRRMTSSRPQRGCAHAGRPQSSAPKPSEQWHVPLAWSHVPRPLQPPGHVALISSQRVPAKPARHLHAPKTHSPRPEQLNAWGHVGSASAA